MLQIFSTTRSNLTQSENLSEMNNVLRYASLIMTNEIGQAGYRTADPTTGVLPDYYTAFAAFSDSLTGNSPTADANDATNGMVLNYFLSGTGTDVGNLWVKFEGDPSGSIRGCNDIYGVANVDVRVLFYAQTLTIGGVESTAYYCELQNDSTDYDYPADTPLGTPLIPAELFDSAWVRYGEDITSSGYIDRWADGADVVNFNNVYAVRVAFLIHSRDDVRNDAVTQTFNIFGQTVTRSDKKVYKLYTFTVPLPNAPNYKGASFVTTP